MNSSLRDQLLNLGLVTEKQARQAAQQEQQRQHRERGRPPAKHENRPGTMQGQPGAGRPGKPQAGKADMPPVTPATPGQPSKVARDQELNRRRHEKAQRKARMAEIQQIVEQHRLPRLETDDHYSFIDGKKIRRMSVDAARRDQLTRGELTIVRYKGHYAVVPAEVGERIRQRDEQMVVPLVKSDAPAEQDEAYKEFVVPDDLMW